MCRARQPVSLEMKVGDGDDTELLELLSGDCELPSEQLKKIARKAIFAVSRSTAPSSGASSTDALWNGWRRSMSLTGIGRILGMSRDRVRNLERDGLAGLPGVIRLKLT